MNYLKGFRDIMLILDRPGAPNFEKINIIKFFKRYKELNADFGLSELEIIKCVLQYCEIIIKQFIRNLLEYEKGVWEDFKKVLLEEFKKYDLY